MRRSRLLKPAQLQRWRARALAAAYLEYAWTHLRWVPRAAHAALPFDTLRVPSDVEGHLDLFEQPERKRVFHHPAISGETQVERLNSSAWVSEWG